jgi:pimeloyl-ACP methyl ester carboxylesterase
MDIVLNRVWRLARLAALMGAFIAPGIANVYADEQLKSCRVDGFAQEVQCGEIRRALDPDQPQGKQIEVHFIVLKAQDKNKAPDPVFLLAGGPGQSAISVASYIQVVIEKLQRRHDLVFVDQRGTGKSAPLECPDHGDLQGIGVADYGVRQILACKNQLEKLPYGDLRFFTTTIAMHDLDAVRELLHYPQIDLIGVSYGTRAALEYQRLFPDHVHRTVLDGVVQPEQMFGDVDMQKALNKVFADCSTDSRCHQAYPDLRADWKKLLAGLPQNAVIIHPRLGTVIKANVAREDVLSWVSKVVYSPVSTAALPHAIEQAILNNFNPLLALAGGGSLPGPGDIAMGMHFSTVCAEEYSRMTMQSPPDADDDFAGMHNQEYIKVCKEWPIGKVPPDFYTTPVSKTPVLLLSGGIDPVTPPWHADKVAAALGTSARHIVLDNAGHGVLQQPCLTDVVASFINAKTDAQAIAVDASCVKQIPRPLVWVAPGTRAQLNTATAPEGK